MSSRLLLFGLDGANIVLLWLWIVSSPHSPRPGERLSPFHQSSVLRAIITYPDNFHYLTRAPQWYRFSFSVLNNGIFWIWTAFHGANVGLPGCSNLVCVEFAHVTLFWNDLFVSDCFFFCSVSFRFRFRSFSVSFVLELDWLSNTDPYFAFNAACSVRMIITFFVVFVFYRGSPYGISAKKIGKF